MEVIVVLLIGAVFGFGFKVRILIPAAFQLARSSPTTPTNFFPSRSPVLIAPCHPIASSAVSEFPSVGRSLAVFREHYLGLSSCRIDGCVPRAPENSHALARDLGTILQIAVARDARGDS